MDQGNKNKTSCGIESDPIKARKRILSCDHCNKKIKTRTNLRRHIRDLHTDSLPKYQYLRCNSAYKRKDDKKTHFKKKHLNEEIIFKITETTITNYKTKIEPVRNGPHRWKQEGMSNLYLESYPERNA